MTPELMLAGFDELTQAVEARLGLEELLFEPATRGELERVRQHFAARREVLGRFGLGRRIRPSGMSVLFIGPPGTGKTEAAASLAAGLGLPLYRVDTASLISPYVGMTAKHLALVLAGVEARAAAVLFDEADVLFARRSPKVESGAELGHNQQVAYLLSRLEKWTGLAFLTTNLAVVDEAFKRRFHAVVEFAIPGPALRSQLWRAALGEAEVDGAVDFTRLGEIELSPGAIQVGAYKAVLDAVVEGAARVEWRHLARAAEEQLALYGRLAMGLR